jgi:hypothetical protein
MPLALTIVYTGIVSVARYSDAFQGYQRFRKGH